MRTTLLTAALTVLQRDGAASLTLRNITAEAGCSTTGVYTYFGGKQGLVEAIYIDGFESFEREMSVHYAADDLMESGRAYRRWALCNPTHYMVMFGSAVPDYVPSEAALERAGQAFAGLVAAVERSGAADPVASAYHLFATVHGYVMLELVGMAPLDRAELEQQYELGLTQCVAIGGDA